MRCAHHIRDSGKVILSLTFCIKDKPKSVRVAATLEPNISELRRQIPLPQGDESSILTALTESSTYQQSGECYYVYDLEASNTNQNTRSISIV